MPDGRPGTAGAISSFLITDIEGSTRLWEEHGAAMGEALALHDHLMRAAVEGCRGTIIKTTGDGLLAIFDDPSAAVLAAIAAQHALRDASWGTIGQLSVRMAVHTGQAESRDGDYFGPALNRSARILAIGHGGQILLSAVAAALSGDRLPASHELQDLGSHRLRDLDRPEQVFQLVAPDLPRDFPPLRSLSTRRSNLPVSLTSFVGRERELAELEGLVTRHRLVTLIGTGGTGKTRLMLEAAGRLGSRFSDGTWLAELAPLGDPSQVASEVARALGAPEVPGQPAIGTVMAFLADKEVLLLLDNAEHLVDGVAGVASQLLAAAPNLRIITTSREALAVQGEVVLQLQSLSCPGQAGARGGRIAPASLDLAGAAGTEAVRLFVERASAASPSFTLGRENVEAVGEICRRLDGIPLAIELAAARVSAMSTGDIALRLGDRFRLLAGGRRTAVPRQQTLHALIDWSWDLLTEDDHLMLRRLSIFTGGWTAQTAARIVGDGLAGMDEVEFVDGLTRLVDRSLVIIDRGPTTRYRMLETIRQYAREKLIEAAEVPTLADRHFAAFASLAIEAEPELRAAGMADWLDRLDADAENLGAALGWGLEASPWEAVRMATALLEYWSVRVAAADNEARIISAIEVARARVVGQPDADPADQARAGRLLGEAARMWAASGRATIGLAWARDAVDLARASGDTPALLSAISGMVMARVFTGGSTEDLTDLLPEAIDLAEQSGSKWYLGLAAGFGSMIVSTFDPVAGEALVLRAERAAQESANPAVIAGVAAVHGSLLGRAGRTDEAVARYGTAMARYAELGDERGVLVARSDIAHTLRRAGRLDEAEASYADTIASWVYLGNRGAVANQLENVAYLAIERGHFQRAATLLGAAERIREVAGTPMAFDEVDEYAGFVDRVRAALPAAEFASAWAAGRARSMTDAVALAMNQA